MGFYGNMTNSVKTNMTFDRKYSSRKNMDDMAASDGVYAGRYVLVEYGLDWTSSVVSDTYNNTDVNKIIKFYKYASNNNNIYKDSSCQMRYEGAEDGQVFYIGGKRSGSRTEACDELWIYKNNKYNLVTDKMLDRTADANYVTNFNIDKELYGAGRGYDSTVWTKTYGTDGIPRYVMIAELNAIIPTFTLSQHAPSANDGKPFAPYFDELGTNVHYNMHVGTPWGMRVAETDSANSDVGTKAIYYNKAGFEEFNRNIINKADFISIEDAKSGYNEYIEGEANDIKELSIYLPSIGNMVAAGWDVIHGEDRKDNPATSLQGRLNFFTKELKENEIPVQSKDGYLVGATAVVDNWINCVIDAENKTITISHDEHNFDTASAGHTNLNAEEGAHQEDNLTIYDWDYDVTGHITSKKEHTYTLPFGYKTITPGSKSEDVVEIDSNITSLVADKTQDTLIIAPGNKWVRMAGDNNDTLTIAHEVHKIEDTEKKPTSLDEYGTFTVQDLVFDEAGHVTANQVHEYKSPYAIRNIKIGNNASVGYGTIPSKAEGQTDAEFSASLRVDAEAYNDTFNLNAQNRWITLNRDKDNRTITIGHAAADTVDNNLNSVNTTEPDTIQFGSKITIPYFKYDKVGHISDAAIHTIELPTVKIGEQAENASSASSKVLTNVSIDSKSIDTIIKTNDDIGDLLLTLNNDINYIKKNDNINTAFTNIDNALNTHVNNKGNPHAVTATQVGLGNVTNDAQVKRSEMGAAGGVATLDVNGLIPASQLPSFVDDVIEADAYDNLPENGEASKIYVTKDNGKTYRWSGTGYAIISDTIALGETAGTAYEGSKGQANAGAIAKLNDTDAVEGSVAHSIKTAIAELDVSDSSVNHQFVTAVSQADGKVAVARASLTSDDIPALEINKITNLQNILNEIDVVKNTIGTIDENEKITIISENINPITETGTIQDILTKLLTRIEVLEGNLEDMKEEMTDLSVDGLDTLTLNIGDTAALNYTISAKNKLEQEVDIEPSLTWTADATLGLIGNQITPTAAGEYKVILNATYKEKTLSCEWIITVIEPPVEETPTE